MDVAKIKQQVYVKIPKVRELDIAAALDMFLNEHKVTGVLTDTTLNLEDYANRKIAVPSAINQVNAVYLNGSLIAYANYDELSYTVGQAYYTGEDGWMYFNFDVDKDNDVIVIRGKVGISTIVEYEDKWTACCIYYVLKELYSGKYKDVEQYSLTMREYEKQKRIVFGKNRQKPKMNFMTRSF